MSLAGTMERALRPTPVRGVARWLYRAVFKRRELHQRRRIMGLYACLLNPGELC